MTLIFVSTFKTRRCARHRCATRQYASSCLAVAVAAIVVHVAVLENRAGAVRRAESDNTVYLILPAARKLVLDGF
jgi:hypothetical protein